MAKKSKTVFGLSPTVLGALVGGAASVVTFKASDRPDVGLLKQSWMVVAGALLGKAYEVYS